MTGKWKLGRRIGPGAILLLLTLPARLVAQGAPANWPPITSGERLVLKISWPSGLPMGEAVMSAAASGKEVHLSLTVDADLPQRRASYSFSSTTDGDLCSIRFVSNIQGSRSVQDTYDFDRGKHEVRQTHNGRSVGDPVAIPDCARDPLALLYFFRRQLALQKVPAGQAQQGSAYLGDELSVRLDPVTKQAEPVPFGAKHWVADRYQVSYTAPGGGNTLDLWLRPDLSRAPVAVSIQFPLATFTAELQ